MQLIPSTSESAPPCSTQTALQVLTSDSSSRAGRLGLARDRERVASEVSPFVITASYPLRSGGWIAPLQPSSTADLIHMGSARTPRLFLGTLIQVSILDLSDAGHLTIETAEGRFAIAYNDECCDCCEVARDLSIGGLRSGSNTAVVLWLVRDRLGIKPTYDMVDSGTLLLASEIRPLLALAGGTPPRNTALLASKTLFRGV